ncbi:MAG: hypothetical protein ACRYGM_07180 [Janthinobacterium lividum]
MPALAEIATLMIDPHPLHLSAEDLYRTVLQAIARGRFDGGRAIAGTETQIMAREALAQMGDDWTKRGVREGSQAGATT